MAGFLPIVVAAADRTARMVAGSGAQLQIVMRKNKVSLMRQVPLAQSPPSL